MAYSETKTKRHYSSSIHRIVYEDGHSADFFSQNNVPIVVSRTGTAVPNFAAKIKARENAGSSYTRNDYRVLQCKPHRASASNDRDETTSVTWNWLSTGTPSLPSNLDFSDLDKRALRSFYHNLGDAMTQFQSLPFLKEFAQTKRLFGETALRLFNQFYGRGGQLGDYARKLKRQRRPWRLASKDLSQRWLEVQFGLLPTIMDLEGLSSALRDPGSSILTIRGGALDVTNVTNVGATHSAYTCVWKSSGSRVTTSQVRYVAGLRIQPSVSDRLGLSLQSIPGSIWEITPWSFLVDYFVDVQGFLNSVTYGSLPAVYVSKSTCRKLKARYITAGSSAPTSSTQSIRNNGVLMWESRRYSRSMLLGLPFYVPSVNICGPFSGFKGLNIAALLGCRIDAW